MHLFDLKMSALFKDLERVLEDSGLIWNVETLANSSAALMPSTARERNSLRRRRIER
jgi:hypothetical protein